MCHELVKRPLNAQMKEVDDEHLDNRGISNLRVPLDVGKPRSVPDKNGATATACDVIFHPSVVERALQGRNISHYQNELGRLSISWVEKEIGTSVRKEFKVGFSPSMQISYFSLRKLKIAPDSTFLMADFSSLI